MSLTDTSAFGEYILTFTQGDATILSGAYRPVADTGESFIDAQGKIVIPVWNSGTVEDISATPSTLTGSNTLVTLTTFDRRRVVHMEPSEWRSFENSRNNREIVARGLGRDLTGDALTKFYAEIVDNGTASTEFDVAAPTGSQIAERLLQEIAGIKAKWMNGVTSKMSIFLNASGSAALAQNQRAAFNYAPTTDPFFGEWMGAKVWVTDDALSGSGTVIGGIFSEFGIAYVSDNIDMIAIGAKEPLTATRLTTAAHTFALKVLDSAQCKFLSLSGSS